MTSKTRAFVIMLTLLVPATSALASSYYKHSSKHWRFNTPVGAKPGDFKGQVGDLDVKVTQIRYTGTPCGNGSLLDVVDGVEVTVTCQWVKQRASWGPKVAQCEGPFDGADADTMTLKWLKQSRWNFTEVRHGGVNILGTPAAVAGAALSFEGVKITLPTSFDTSWNAETYVLFWEYVPQAGDGCTVFARQAPTGTFIHTYDAELHTSSQWFMSMTPAANFPWNIAVGGNPGWSNDHAWSKPVQTYAAAPGWSPPTNFVSRVSCCPTGVSYAPLENPYGYFNESSLIDPVTPGSDHAFSAFGVPATGGIVALEIVASDPRGGVLGSVVRTFDPPCWEIEDPCEETVDVLVPNDYDADILVLTSRVTDEHGLVFEDSIDLPVVAPFAAAVLATDSDLEDRMLLDDVLTIDITDHTPEILPADVGGNCAVWIVDSAGTIIDVENGFPFVGLGNGLFRGILPASSTTEPVNFDGVLSTRSDWHAQIFYFDLDGPQSKVVLPIVASATALPWAGDVATMTYVEVGGSGLGFAMTVEVNGIVIWMETWSGMTSETAADFIAAAANEAAGAPVAERVGPAGIRLAPVETFSVSMLDPGLVLTAVADAGPCPEDLDESGSVGFGDLLMLLSDWGPCANCASDLDDNGDIGFTDLLTLLSMWGPCP